MLHAETVRAATDDIRCCKCPEKDTDPKSEEVVGKFAVDEANKTILQSA
jgi:hypothetical protein